jgi:hypothetical protein
MSRMHGVGAVAVALWLGAAPAPAPVRKSVRGTLQGVDAGLRAVVMRTDDGKRVAWRFGPAVIAEVAKVAVGSPTIVIYRQTSPSEKRVTAIAFPGTAPEPTYVNLTGERVLLRSAAAVGGACEPVDGGPARDSLIPPGGRLQIPEGCWCCAPSDGTCAPTTRSGQGLAFLESCFE